MKKRVYILFFIYFIVITFVILYSYFYILHTKTVITPTGANYQVVLKNGKLLYVDQNPIYKIHQPILGFNGNDQEEFLWKDIFYVTPLNETMETKDFEIFSKNKRYYLDDIDSSYLTWKNKEEQKEEAKVKLDYFIQDPEDGLDEYLIVQDKQGNYYALDVLLIESIVEKKSNEEILEHPSDNKESIIIFEEEMKEELHETEMEEVEQQMGDIEY